MLLFIKSFEVFHFNYIKLKKFLLISLELLNLDILEIKNNSIRQIDKNY